MPPGKEIVAVSEYMTFPEYIELWGRINGVKAEYKEITRAELFEGVPEPLASEIGDSFDYVHDFGFTGGDPDVLQPEQLHVKVPTTSMEEYIRSEDWSSVLNM